MVNVTNYFGKPPEPREREQVQKLTHRVNKREGPMAFLATQIIKRMEKAGYPCKLFCLLRTAEDQEDAFLRGVSKAQAFESAHQYYEAGDFVHPKLFWDVSPDYWEALATCVRNVASDYNVALNHGHHWRFVDSAHVELEDWRLVRRRIGKRHPTEDELAERFKEVLPSIPL